MGKRFIYYNAPSGFDPDAFALITAAGYTNNALKLALNKWYVNAKLNGYYPKIDAGYFDVADDISSNAASLAQMKWNFVNPLNTDAAHRRTYFNNPTANYTGIDFNGTTQYIDIHFAANLLSGNNDSYAVYLAENSAGFRVDMGVYNGSGYLLFGNFDPVNGAVYYNDGGASFVSGGMIGMWVVNTNVKETFKNAVLINNIAGAGTAGPGTDSIFEGALSQGGASSHSDRKQVFSCYCINNALTTLESAALSNDVNVLQGEIESALGLAPGTRKKY